MKAGIKAGIDVCLRESCDRKVHCRGLCKPDYTMAAKLVRQKETTWKRLEEDGKANPKGFDSATAWFRNGKAKKEKHA